MTPHIFLIQRVGEKPEVCTSEREALSWADEFGVHTILRLVPEDGEMVRDVTSDLARDWFAANWTPADGLKSIPALFLSELESDAQEAINRYEDADGTMTRADNEYDLRRGA